VGNPQWDGMDGGNQKRKGEHMLIVQIDSKKYTDICGNKRTLKEWRAIYGKNLELSRHAYLARKKWKDSNK
jgi:hypothetical protein